MTTVDCETCRRLAPDLALGIAEGTDRDAVIGHIAGCAACRRDLDDLAAVADALLVAAPTAEPPSGFETRALAGFHAEAETPDAPRPAGWRHRLTRTRVVVAVAAVVALLVAGYLVGPWATGDGAPDGDRRELATGTEPATPSDTGTGTDVGGPYRGGQGQGAEVDRAALTLPDGTEAGEVVVRHGHPTELEVHLAQGAASGRYRVACDYRSGPSLDAGTVPAGADAWTTTVDRATYDLTRVRLVSVDDGPNLEATMDG
mgnify:CR=1 FL=1